MEEWRWKNKQDKGECKGENGREKRKVCEREREKKRDKERKRHWKKKKDQLRERE